MGATNERRKRAFSLNRGLAIPVHLQQDELLSSWLVRVALANGCDPLVISWAIWDKWRGWIIDIDRNPGYERLAALAKFSGENFDTLIDATLASTAVTILGREPNPNELWPWILTTGTRNRLRKSGIQYCVECLRSDVKPFFRRQWRFAWHVACPIHLSSLRDCCPHCQAPIEPHRLVAEDRVIVFCASCRRSLVDSVPLPILHTDALIFQGWIDEILHFETPPIAHGKIVNAHSWYEIARYYSSFVRRSVINPHPALQSFSEVMGFNVHQSILNDALKMDFEQMSVIARSALLVSIFKLIKTPMHELIKILNESTISRQCFTGAKHQFPQALGEIADSLVDNPRVKRINSRKIHGSVEKLPNPKPHWEVNRAWQQLLKKLDENPAYGQSI